MRRVYEEGIPRLAHRRPRPLFSPRLAALGTVARHDDRPDGVLFPRKGQAHAHPETALPARPDRRARLSEHAPRQRAVQWQRDLYRSTDIEGIPGDPRSEEHTSELQSLMRHSYAVFC